VTEFNKVWLADITYIRVNSKWNYLAAVMVLGRRKIVGWALGTSPNANLACKALKQALLEKQPGFGLISSLRPWQPVHKQSVAAAVGEERNNRQHEPQRCPL